MENEKAFNILRGIVIASYLDDIEKNKIIEFINNLENKED